MIDTCKRLAKKYSSLTLGLAGLCVMISPVPLCMNIKLLDEHNFYVTDDLYLYFRTAMTSVTVICCVANLAGICLIAVAIMIRLRRKKPGAHTGI